MNHAKNLYKFWNEIHDNEEEKAAMCWIDKYKVKSDGNETDILLCSCEFEDYIRRF